MNDNLSPQQFYHGTSGPIANLIEKSGLPEGTHLTTNPDAARQYARYASGGSAWTEDKRKQGVVLSVLAVHESEVREGPYGLGHHFVKGHSITTHQIEPERIRRT